MSLPIPDEVHSLGSFSGGAQTVWDSTSLGLWQSCPRKYYHKIIRGLSRYGNKSVHLIFGGIYAKALEEYYLELGRGSTSDEALAHTISRALIRAWHWEGVELGELPPEDATSIGPWLSDHAQKTRFTLIRSIIWYFEEFSGDSALHPITIAGAPAVELTFKLELSPNILYSGHLDRLAEWQGHTYVIDQKTTGTTITARYFDQYHPSTQMTGYTFAGKVVYNVPVKGVIIDAAQIAAGFTRFSRAPTLRTDDQLEEWHSETIHWITQAQAFTAESFFPMNPAACNDYGGCEFRRICQAPCHLREAVIKSDYVISPRWDPSKVR